MATPSNGEVIIVDAKGIEHVFPSGFDPKKAAAIVAQTAPREKPSTNAAVELSATSALAPYLQRGMTELATNPNVPKMGAKIGRVIGGVAPVVGGLSEGGPIGGLVGLAASAKGAWAGGKGGWFTGKLAQNVAAPIARAGNALAPYLEKLNPVTGAQGLLDLAQMAEPDRQDIGFMGIGRTSSAPTRPSQAARKAQEKADLGYINLSVQHGSTPQEAAIKLANGDAGRLAEIMNLYIRAHK